MPSAVTVQEAYKKMEDQANRHGKTHVANIARKKIQALHIYIDNETQKTTPVSA